MLLDNGLEDSLSAIHATLGARSLKKFKQLKENKFSIVLSLEPWTLWTLIFSPVAAIGENDGVNDNVK